jgi:initiation factor 1A
MVKNTGGNKAKGQARKFVTAAKEQKSLRTSCDVLELYAQISKNFGNGMVDADCIDGVLRLCHIRGKFRGRGKKDNTVSVGSWVLVGLREYESGGNKLKKQNCDLLEVYSDFDKERLKITVSQDWSAFIARDNAITNQDKRSCENTDGVIFGTNKNDYLTLMERAQDNKGGESKVIADKEDDTEINVDDI